MRPTPPPRVVRGIYGLALCALPRELRRGRADELRTVFDEMWAEARNGGTRTLAVLLAREVCDVVAAGVNLRLREPGRARAAGGETGRGGEMFQGLWQDVRISTRMLFRRPGFVLIATVTLALGIGGSTAIFGVVNAVILTPLPYPDADELVMVWHTIPRIGWERGPWSYGNYDQVRSATTELGAVAMHTGHVGTLLGEGPPLRVTGRAVSGNLFGLLGVQAELGRILGPADDNPAAERVVVLSHAMWMRAFGADPDVIGQLFRLDDGSPTVVGVMPADFPSLSTADEYWLPIALDEEGRQSDSSYLQMIGRLAPRATAASAQTDVARIVERATRGNPDDAARGVFLETRHEYVVGDVKAQLLLMLGAVALVLLAACANVAGLTLTRGANRRRDHAIRVAMGANRGRLVRYLLSESMVVAVLGAVGGVAVAYGLTAAVLTLGPVDLPRRDQISVDATTLLFMLGVTTICVVIFGLLPALKSADADPVENLREGVSGSVGRLRTQQALASVQIALALILMVGGGLLTRSLMRLQDVDLGFAPEGVLTAFMPLDFEQHVERVTFADQLLERVGAFPGVRNAALGWSIPFGRNWGSTRVLAEATEVALEDRPQARMVPIRGGYFEALGIEVIAGGAVPESVAPEDPLVVVVNEAFARALWPGEETVVGKRFRRGRMEGAPWNTVVGVVADTRASSLTDDAPLMLYQPLEQAGWISNGYLVLRTEEGLDPLSVVFPLRRAVAALDAELALDQVMTLQARVSATSVEPRFRAQLVGLFAGVVGLLALVGIYGVMGLVVAGRTHDIGVRMALGAPRGVVMGEVLRQGAVVGAVGIGFGLIGAVALSRLLEGLLFEIGVLDPMTYALVSSGCSPRPSSPCCSRLAEPLRSTQWWCSARTSTNSQPIVNCQCAGI